MAGYRRKQEHLIFIDKQIDRILGNSDLLQFVNSRILVFYSRTSRLPFLYSFLPIQLHVLGISYITIVLYLE